MEDTDSIAELRRQLREQVARAEEASRDLQRERQHTEAERRRAEAERLRADQAESQSRPTTLTEYIGKCHEYLHCNVTVESNKSLTSKGSITSPQSKYVPSRLSEWRDFLDTQRTTLGDLYEAFPADDRVFETLGFLRGLGERLAERNVANERDLERVQHSIVEDPVSKIVNVLRRYPAAVRQFDLANGIVFDNHPNALSDGAEEPMRRRGAFDANQLRADQVCVYRHDDGTDPARRTLAFVIEYKAPHKLTMPHLRLGLRELDIQEEVVNRATVPTDPDARFQSHADRIVAAAVTQTYHYMITGGLEYSYLTTGEAYVFFKIDWATPGHLMFHLAEPRLEVEAHPDNANHCTAVSQVLAFTLCALKSRPRGQDERHQAMEQLGTWLEDYEVILRGIPATERKQTPPPSAFQPRTYRQVDRSPYVLRRGGTGSCRPPSSDPTRDESPAPSDDDGGGPSHESPSLRSSRRLQPQAPSSPGNPRDGAPGSSQPYCTQRCLLGLVRGGPLDQACPNVLLHRRDQPGRTDHPLDRVNWLRKLRDQLTRSLDADVIPLWKQGSRGAALQVTLAKYGYTVLAKCTVPEFVPDLVYEGSMYGPLKPLQGVGVPVFLGAINLEPPYEYDHRVRLVHMTLLSSAGSPVSTTARPHLPEFEQNLGKLLDAIRGLGVIHGDVHDPNICWCPETKGPMLIDFDRATLDCPWPPITKTGSPKRTRDRTSWHRRSQSVGSSYQLQPIVLNGRGRRRRGKPYTGKKDLACPYDRRSLENSVIVEPVNQDGGGPVKRWTQGNDATQELRTVSDSSRDNFPKLIS